MHSILISVFFSEFLHLSHSFNMVMFISKYGTTSCLPLAVIAKVFRKKKDFLPESSTSVFMHTREREDGFIKDYVPGDIDASCGGF
jgi:hypothetical protein